MRTLTLEEEQRIIDLYVNHHKGQLACAYEVLHIKNGNYTKAVLKKYNIPIRNFSQAAILSNKKRAKFKNENYFATESHNMAWILGFLASDGSIRLDRNEIKIGLSIKDKEILEKIKQEIQIENEIKEYTTSSGHDCCRLTWTCEKHKQDLAKYSIIPQKTFKLKPPYELNKEYWIDYIRGYFDGDGSINLITNSNGRGNGNLRWQVASATKEILEFIVNTFYEMYNIPKVNILCDIKHNNGADLYYIQYSSTATRKIYNILYTPNSLYLKRKKDKFEEVLKLVKPLNEI